MPQASQSPNRRLAESGGGSARGSSLGSARGSAAEGFSAYDSQQRWSSEEPLRANRGAWGEGAAYGLGEDDDGPLGSGPGSGAPSPARSAARSANSSGRGPVLGSSHGSRPVSAGSHAPSHTRSRGRGNGVGLHGDASLSASVSASFVDRRLGASQASNDAARSWDSHRGSERGSKGGSEGGAAEASAEWSGGVRQSSGSATAREFASAAIATAGHRLQWYEAGSPGGGGGGGGNDDFRGRGFTGTEQGEGAGGRWSGDGPRRSLGGDSSWREPAWLSGTPSRSPRASAQAASASAAASAAASASLSSVGGGLASELERRRAELAALEASFAASFDSNTLGSMGGGGLGASVSHSLASSVAGRAYPSRDSASSVAAPSAAGRYADPEDPDDGLAASVPTRRSPVKAAAGYDASGGGISAAVMGSWGGTSGQNFDRGGLADGPSGGGHPYGDNSGNGDGEYGDEYGGDEEDVLFGTQRFFAAEARSPLRPSAAVGAGAVGGSDDDLTSLVREALGPQSPPRAHAQASAASASTSASAGLASTLAAAVSSSVSSAVAPAAAPHELRPSQLVDPQLLRASGGASIGAREAAEAAEPSPALGSSLPTSDDDSVELIFNPVLNCYYDPRTGKFFQLKGPEAGES